MVMTVSSTILALVKSVAVHSIKTFLVSKVIKLKQPIAEPVKRFFWSLRIDQKVKTPNVWLDVEGETRLISSAAQGTFAYEPRTGKEIWKLAHTGFSMSSRPILAAGNVILNTGYMRPSLIAIPPTGTGTLEEEQIAWRYQRSVPSIPSPICVDDRIYFVHDNGTVACIDARSLKPACQAARSSCPSRQFRSPWRKST